MTRFTNLFISKNRKVNFDLSIIIRDLVNIPLVSGYYYINWKLKNASHTSGTTERVHIKDHDVVWNHPITTILQVVIDKQQTLSNSVLKMEIHQQGGKEIGSLSINLSEYAGLGVKTERYLLQNSKFNSTLKLTLRMDIRQDTTLSQNYTSPQFHIPPLSTSQFIKDIPSIIQERNNKGLLQPPEARARKSASVISLPRYCNLQAPCSEEPSPIDVVEKLFAARVDPI